MILTPRRRWMIATRAPTALLVGGLLVMGLACNEESAAPREPLPLVASEVGPLAATNLRGLGLAIDDASGWIVEAELAGWLLELASSDDEASVGPDDIPLDREPSVRDRLDELSDRLEQEILVGANVVRETPVELVFTIPVATLCPARRDAPADDACVARFTATPLSLQVASFVAGELELTLLVGADELAPVLVTLGRTRLVVDVDSATLLASLERLGTSALAGPDRTGELELRAASGRLRLEVDERGARTVAVTLTTSSGLVIDASVGGHPVKLSLARSSLSVVLDAARGRISATSDVGALGVRMPFQLLADLTADDEVEPASVGGELVLDVPGQTAKVELDEASGQLRVDRLGMGSRRSTLALSGETVVSVDLHAGRGREVSLTLREGDDGLALAVSPGMELVVELGLARLSAIAPELATSWAASETLGLALDGAPTPSLVVGDALRVTAGRLALVSTTRPELSLEVRAGQCLVGDAREDVAGETTDGEVAPHPLERLRAGSCEGP